MSSGYPSDWHSRRREVYERDDYQCQNCGQKGGTYGDAKLHAHHIVPKSKGGTHHPENLSTLCKECHGAVHGDSMAPTHRDSVAQGDQGEVSQFAEILGSIFNHTDDSFNIGIDSERCMLFFLLLDLIHVHDESARTLLIIHETGDQPPKKLIEKYYLSKKLLQKHIFGADGIDSTLDHLVEVVGSEKRAHLREFQETEEEYGALSNLADLTIEMDRYDGGKAEEEYAEFISASKELLLVTEEIIGIWETVIDTDGNSISVNSSTSTIWEGNELQSGFENKADEWIRTTIELENRLDESSGYVTSTLEVRGGGCQQQWFRRNLNSRLPPSQGVSRNRCAMSNQDFALD